MAAFCGACGAALAEGTRFCGNCGASVPGLGVAAPAQQPAAIARQQPAPAKKKGGVGRIVGAFILIILATIAAVQGVGSKGAGTPSGGGTPPAGGSNITGKLDKWVPVDDAHGYAYFTITNHGSSAATARCTIEVRDDFGDFGFDSLVGESLAPGQTLSSKVALSVGKGAHLINAGSVKDC